MKHFYKSFFFFFLICSKLVAQVLPTCQSNTIPPTDLCADACNYCDFNGMTSTTVGYTGQTPPGWCGAIENEQWLGFTASCNSVTFIATPTNCVDGNGLEMGVYESCTGTPLACSGGICQGLTPVFVTVGTIPGQQYLLCIDGWAGDQCDFTITVVPPGCAGYSALSPTMPIQIMDTACVGLITAYVPPVSDAAFYVWSGPSGSLINGVPPPVTLQATSGNAVTITNTGAVTGLQEICVQPINSCSNGTVQCKNVFFASDIAPINNLGNINICQGEAYSICGNTYTQSGNYVVTCPNTSGCDSVMTFTLNVDTSILIQDLILQHPTSSMAADGSAQVTVTGGSGTLTYVWTNQLGQVVGNSPVLSGVPTGSYTLTVRDQAGCATVRTVVLSYLLDSDDEVESRCKIAVVPNPASQAMRIICNDVQELANVQIFSNEGRLLGEFADYQFGTVIDLRGLQTGLLYLRVRIGSYGTEVLRFVHME